MIKKIRLINSISDVREMIEAYVRVHRVNLPI